MNIRKKSKDIMKIIFFSLLVIVVISCKKETGADIEPVAPQVVKNIDVEVKAHEIQGAFGQVYQFYKDKVVFITTEKYVRVRSPYYGNPYFQQKSRVQKRTGLGTGFIISDDGFICTNHHVIAGADKVLVKINEKTYEAEVIGTDQRTDIALLKVDSKEKLKSVVFGDSDHVNVGDWAIAIGNPFGLEKTFTVGVISAKGRKDVDLLGGAHIQTDASINPGNSGGPLINIKGQVIGVNRMIYSKSGGYMGIGFAIPINTGQHVLDQLKKFGRVKRGFIGIGLAQTTKSYIQSLGYKDGNGVLVGDVVRNGPAEKAGLRINDLIIEVNRVRIFNYKDLLNVISNFSIGKKLEVVVLRNSKKVKLYIKVAERPVN